MSCNIGTCWHLNKETIRSVYVYNMTGIVKQGGMAKVLVGNLKNLNPNHTIECEDDELFERDPTTEQIQDYINRYENGDIPINQETGRNDDIWIEEIPQHELMTAKELMEYINSNF